MILLSMIIHKSWVLVSYNCLIYVSSVRPTVSASDASWLRWGNNRVSHVLSYVTEILMELIIHCSSCLTRPQLLVTAVVIPQESLPASTHWAESCCREVELILARLRQGADLRRSPLTVSSTSHFRYSACQEALIAGTHGG